MASANLDLVRSIYAAWERGDFLGTIRWAHPEIEFVVGDGLSPGGLTGVAAIEANWREFMETWENYRAEADEYRELDDDRVLVFFHASGRAKTSGMEISQTQQGANVFHVRDGKVERLVVYWDSERALDDLGLAPEE